MRVSGCPKHYVAQHLGIVHCLQQVPCHADAWLSQAFCCIALRDFSVALQQVLAVAEIREDLEQQLQRIERHRQALTERKVAEQRRLIRLLDAQLKEACDSCSAHEKGLRELLGDAAKQLQACTGLRSGACLVHAPPYAACSAHAPPYAAPLISECREGHENALTELLQEVAG